MKQDSQDVWWVAWMAERYLDLMVTLTTAQGHSLTQKSVLEAHDKDMRELIARVRARQLSTMETIVDYELATGARVQ